MLSETYYAQKPEPKLSAYTCIYAAMQGKCVLYN